MERSPGPADPHGPVERSPGPADLHGPVERSPAEGISYPLQYSWASLEAQLVKILPAMQETPVLFHGCDDPLEKG